MKHSESLTAFAGAMAKAQAAMTGAKKDAKNAAYDSKYADLSAVVSVIRSALTSNGLSYMQFPVPAEGDACGVETMLLHESGEWVLSDPCMVPVSKANAHGYGSALTYSRRYGLVSACGLETADDDGNDAAKAAPAKVEPSTEMLLKLSTIQSMPELALWWGKLSKEDRMSLSDAKDKLKKKLEAVPA